ncbi:MAG: hypothetical protein Q8765_02510 [Sweet potato little leaf phytoplasma]|nr:hypothetical protein [Sweet potato little leaf phytoplasma]
MNNKNEVVRYRTVVMKYKVVLVVGIAREEYVMIAIVSVRMEKVEVVVVGGVNMVRVAVAEGGIGCKEDDNNFDPWECSR